jgi:hypothetical protein
VATGCLLEVLRVISVAIELQSRDSDLSKKRARASAPFGCIRRVSICRRNFAVVSRLAAMVVTKRLSRNIDLAGRLGVPFTISGPGALVGLDAGDSTNHDSYKGTSHAAFSGKLMAIVQSTTNAGMITLNATSGSLMGSSVAITTAAP